jgi:hypothetical protein
MEVGIYDKSAFAQYTPLSAQEILMPAQLMREKHDKLDEEYGQINDELQKIAFIADNDPNPALKQKYNDYLNSLTQARDSLMEKGLNANSKRDLLNIRGRFQKDIQPINLGYQMKLNDINNYNQTKLKDPTYIGQDPSLRSVSDYLDNGLQPFTQNGISGALVTKMASDFLAPFSNVTDSTGLKDLLSRTVGTEEVPQYMEYFKKFGYKPGTEGHKKLMELAKNNIINATGVSSWANEDQLNAINGHINLASSATIGKEQSQVVNNNAWIIAQQKAQAKEQANEYSPDVLWTNNPRQAVPVDREEEKRQLDNLIKKRENKKTDLSKARDKIISLGVLGKNTEKENILNKFEQGDITEDELRDSISKLSQGSKWNSNLFSDIVNSVSDNLFGTDLDNYIKEVNKDLTRIYDQRVSEDPNLSLEQFMEETRKDIQYKSTLINNPYISNNTAVQGYQKNLFDNYINNIYNTDAIVLDKNNKKEKFKDKNKLFKTVRNNTNTTPSGINLFNPDLNAPSADFITTDNDGNPYNISIPLSKGSNEYKIIAPYSNLLKEVNKPYVKGRKVNINNQEFEIVRSFENGEPNYSIVDKDNNSIDLKSIEKGIQRSLDNLFKTSSQPISKY